MAGDDYYYARLDVIRCRSTEDYSGEDEISVKVRRDGEPAPGYRWDGVSEGDEKFAGGTYLFKESLEVELVERDPGLNDNLGSVTITKDNINDRYARIDPFGFGDYSLVWTNLTKPRNDILKRHSEASEAPPSFQALQCQSTSISSEKAKGLHWSLHGHVHQGDRVQKVYIAMKEAVYVHNGPSSQSEKNESIKKLKIALGFGVLRSIIDQAANKKFPTIVVLGLASPINLGFADFTLSYGFAISTEGNAAKMLIAIGADLGLPGGGVGKIGIGINRNEPEGVPGWTYNLTTSADGSSMGGITKSFDLKPEGPDLQEIMYTWSPLPSAFAAGYAYSAGIP